MEVLNIQDTIEENILLQIVREVCSGDSTLSDAVKSKVTKIMSECDLAPYLSLHTINTVDESASNVLGLVQKYSTELTFDEQSELNQAVIQAIQSKLPALTKELNALFSRNLLKDSHGLLQQDIDREEKKRALIESVDNKLNTLKEQQGEKAELMMDWLVFKMQDALSYTNNITDLYAVKTKTLELKSKILHLQILHSMFTETSSSVKAYAEFKKDLQQSILESENKIQEYKHIIHND